jgi:pimeloyl-ACP methyl ester carboxylesterase
MSSEQTYVLVPGAGGDAWYWHLVAPLLREAGHEVVAPDLPAADEHAGLAAYADIVVDAIGDRRRVVVVAQSMGAFPATMACERADVASLVLVVPMIPAPGETPGEWWTATGQVEAERELALREGRDPDAPFDVTTAFLHDVPPAVIEALFARPEPHESDRAFGDPWPLDAWPDVPTRVLAGRHDRLLPFEFLCALARRRVGVACEPLDSGHLPALARPRELADRLLTGAPERVATDR